MLNILIIDDHPAVFLIFQAYLERTRYANARLSKAHNADEAARAVETQDFDAIFLDNRIPPDFNFRDTLRHMLNTRWNGKVILHSGEAVRALGDYPEDTHIYTHLLKDDLSPASLEHILEQYLPSDHQAVA